MDQQELESEETEGDVMVETLPEAIDIEAAIKARDDAEKKIAAWKVAERQKAVDELAALDKAEADEKKPYLDEIFSIEDNYAKKRKIIANNYKAKGVVLTESSEHGFTEQPKATGDDVAKRGQLMSILKNADGPLLCEDVYRMASVDRIKARQLLRPFEHQLQRFGTGRSATIEYIGEK